jgi:hypothetical protein
VVLRHRELVAAGVGGLVPGDVEAHTRAVADRFDQAR